MLADHNTTEHNQDGGWPIGGVDVCCHSNFIGHTSTHIEGEDIARWEIT